MFYKWFQLLQSIIRQNFLLTEVIYDFNIDTLLSLFVNQFIFLFLNCFRYLFIALTR